MRFRAQPRLVSISLTALSVALLLAGAIGAANARDFEMGGDSNYSIMAPEPGTGSHHAARNRHGRTSRHQSQSLTATEKALQDRKRRCRIRRRLRARSTIRPSRSRPSSATAAKRRHGDLRASCCRRRCPGRRITEMSALPPRRCAASSNRGRPSCHPAAPFRTCRMARRRSRTAPRAARSSLRSTTSMPASSAATWVAACSCGARRREFYEPARHFSRRLFLVP